MRLVLLPGQCAAYNLPFKESHKYALIVPGPKVNDDCFHACPFRHKANLSVQVFLKDDLLVEKLCFTDPVSDSANQSLLDSTDDCVIELWNPDNITVIQMAETELRIVMCNVHNDKENAVLHNHDSYVIFHPRNAASIWQIALSKVSSNIMEGWHNRRTYMCSLG